MNTINHCGIAIKTLFEYDTPQDICNKGDLFIQQNEQGWWVSEWDGGFAHDTSDTPADTLDEAIAWAKGVAEAMQLDTD